MDAPGDPLLAAPEGVGSEGSARASARCPRAFSSGRRRLPQPGGTLLHRQRLRCLLVRYLKRGIATNPGSAIESGLGGDLPSAAAAGGVGRAAPSRRSSSPSRTPPFPTSPRSVDTGSLALASSPLFAAPRLETHSGLNFSRSIRATKRKGKEREKNTTHKTSNQYNSDQYHTQTQGIPHRSWSCVRPWTRIELR
jgi:hypothetical protein